MAGMSPAAGQKTRQVWTPEEDQRLVEAVAKETPKFGPVSWHKIAVHLPGRNNKDCRKRWHYSIANNVRKGTWTREEDARLREAVEAHGTRWSKIAEAVGTRNGDQCWKRWYDCLDPRIDKSPWTAGEDAKLLHLVSLHGRSWSDMVHRHFPNRTALAAKNRYSILRRRHESVRSKSQTRRSGNPAASSSPCMPSSSSSSPHGSRSPAFLSVPPTPSRTALSTPEPDFASEEWMSAELDEFLAPARADFGCTGWSPTPSPCMEMEHLHDTELDWGRETWAESQPQLGWAFDGLVGGQPQAQTALTAGTGLSGCYAQGQGQGPVQGHAHGDTWDGYPGQVCFQVPRLEMQDVSGELAGTGAVGTELGVWQDGFGGGW